MINGKMKQKKSLKYRTESTYAAQFMENMK